MQSMDGTGMAGNGTPPGRAATAAVAGAVMEVAMVPATAAAMAEGVAAAVAAGIERSSQPPSDFLYFFCVRCFFFIRSLNLTHTYQSVGRKCNANNISYMILLCSHSLSVVRCQYHTLSRMPHISNVVLSCI
jgi:hypothetical protein